VPLKLFGLKLVNKHVEEENNKLEKSLYKVQVEAHKQQKLVKDKDK
jgi:hypothetical protein